MDCEAEPTKAPVQRINLRFYCRYHGRIKNRMSIVLRIRGQPVQQWRRPVSTRGAEVAATHKARIRRLKRGVKHNPEWKQVGLLTTSPPPWWRGGCCTSGGVATTSLFLVIERLPRRKSKQPADSDMKVIGKAGWETPMKLENKFQSIGEVVQV